MVCRHELLGTPAIDPIAFPNTVDSIYYWTSSSYALSPGGVWALDFDWPYSYYSVAWSLELVRCVRGSRCYPTSRFVGSNGLVTDTLTNLVWQQQASTSDMSWTAAQTYCPSGFRLPTLKELESLVDLTVTSAPTVNQTAFPDTPADWYWTSSLYAGSSGSAWSVAFSDGYSFLSAMGYSYAVRCVR